MKLFVVVWWAVCVFAVLCLFVQDAHAQTTVRPYKFGFTIDEQQHRSEKRDERGIVMGEFGFITADGIYHVTVYATDEEGKFRILAMRNYPYESPPKTIDMILVPQRKATTAGSRPSTTAAPTTTKRTLPKFNYKNDACSGCSLPERTAKPQIVVQSPAAGKKSNPKTNIRTLSKIIPSNGSGATFGATTEGSGSGIGGIVGSKFGNNAAVPTTTAGKPKGSVLPTLSQTPFKTPSIAVGAPSNGFKKNTPVSGVQGTRVAGVAAFGAPTKAFPNRTAGSLNKPTIPKQGGKVGAGGSTSGANSSRIGANGNSGSNGVGGGSGANAGAAVKPFGGTNSNAAASAADGGGDLYRFKYTLDYNGHKETGSRNGNKQGNFFSVGDDNVERTIEYIANEFGFQPRIRWRKLEASVPSKENTLKDYEFVWFKQP